MHLCTLLKVCSRCMGKGTWHSVFIRFLHSRQSVVFGLIVGSLSLYVWRFQWIPYKQVRSIQAAPPQICKWVALSHAFPCLEKQFLTNAPAEVKAFCNEMRTEKHRVKKFCPSSTKINICSWSSCPLDSERCSHKLCDKSLAQKDGCECRSCSWSYLQNIQKKTKAQFYCAFEGWE